MITNVFHKPERHALIGHQQVTRGLVGQNKRFTSKESQSHLQREFHLRKSLLAEVLQHTLENQGIYVSAGSACSSHKRAGSPTLTAIDAPREEMESSVRFSFAENNTEEEVDEALAYLKQMLPMLRRYRRK